MAGLIARTPELSRVRSVVRPIVLALADGEPVPLDSLAAATGRSVKALTRDLMRTPCAEWSADGRLAGFGLTLRPTPHRLETASRDLYVWAPFDGLLSAGLLRQDVRIVSSCQLTATTIRIRLSEHAVESVEPAGAVVSVVAQPEQLPELRWRDIARQLFFRDARVASRWATANPGFDLLDIRDGYELARALAAGF